MAWIQIDQALPTHRKTLRLADALDITPTHAVGLMVTLWLWSLDNAPNGLLDDIPPRTLSRILQWDGDSEELMNAMRGAGFLDENEIHDWQEYAGRLLDQRVAAKERMRKHRAALSRQDEQNGHVADTLRETCSNVTRTEQEQSAHVHSRVQYTTPQETIEQDTTEELDPLPPKGEKQQPIPFEKIMQLFNEICVSFSKVTKIEGQRKKAVAARWRTYKNLESFETLFRMTQSSSFLKGNNDRNWVANFDWIMKADNMAKVLENRYTDEKGGKRNENNPEYRLSGFHSITSDDIDATAEEWRRKSEELQKDTAPHISGFHMAGDDDE